MDHFEKLIENKEKYFKEEKIGEVFKLTQFGWIYFLVKNRGSKIDNVGKWMYFFDDKEEDFEKNIEKLCLNAVKEGVIQECKYTHPDFMREISTCKTGVACFYLNCNDTEGHKRIIKYFIDNDLIRKTKTGKYYNISFKLDAQTDKGEYGDDFKATIKLEDFIDLYTGEWKV